MRTVFSPKKGEKVPIQVLSLFSGFTSYSLSLDLFSTLLQSAAHYIFFRCGRRWVREKLEKIGDQVELVKLVYIGQSRVGEGS